jgi:hypothetical protein
MLRFRELFNQVWGLEGCLPIFSPALKPLNLVAFSVETVLVVCRGDQVSFNTTVGGVDVNYSIVQQRDDGTFTEKSHHGVCCRRFVTFNHQQNSRYHCYQHQSCQMSHWD